jgi:signal transduction histidine kinase
MQELTTAISQRSLLSNAHATAMKSRTGTGLGLFISKSIIDAHGGKIWGKNNYPEGKGATFGFSLPPQNKNYKPLYTIFV